MYSYIKVSDVHEPMHLQLDCSNWFTSLYTTGYQTRHRPLITRLFLLCHRKTRRRVVKSLVDSQLVHISQVSCNLLCVEVDKVVTCFYIPAVQVHS